VVVALGAIAVAAAVDHHQVQVEALRAAVLQGQADQEDRLNQWHGVRPNNKN
jgi:hypothetical protein